MRPPVLATKHSKPNDTENTALDRTAQAEAAYQKGHDALTAGKKMIAIEQFKFACERLDAKSCFNVGLLFEGHLMSSNARFNL